MLTIRAAQQRDWFDFCALATSAGWRVPEFELKLFQNSWADCVQVLDLDGLFGGLVTAVPYEQSGWIGNLIVPPALRGKGCGGRLFQAALESLAARGMKTVWLTASTPGRPLYEKAGFVAVNQVKRFVLRRRIGSDIADANPADAVDQLLKLDQELWKERRLDLLETVSWRGRTLACDDSVALLQKGADLQIIGPWYSRSRSLRANRELLRELLSAADPDIEIVADLLASSPICSLLSAAGFRMTGEAVLMARGDIAEIDLDSMVALASLGSIG